MPQSRVNDDWLLGKCSVKLGGQCLRFVRRIDAIGQDDKLVASEPREQIFTPQGSSEAGREGSKRQVSHAVTMTVVDAFEVIQVQVPEADGRPVEQRTA